ncbi:hypothetical protein SMB34_18020 [Thalassospira permensis NBRC 106175]|uniref:Uncharacterized protein n=1 Tax=Thalassospira permensis NBRC 106175 TaxID=1353532 RepID=A0ABR4TPT3_9PROT|nr:hypothetical protein SMB34_18020 [Thalassospira permensis NBRC 106175]
MLFGGMPPKARHFKAVIVILPVKRSGWMFIEGH